MVSHPLSLGRRNRSCFSVRAFQRRQRLRAVQYHVRAGVPDRFSDYSEWRCVGQRLRRLREAPIRNCLRSTRRKDWTRIYASPRTTAHAPTTRRDIRHGLWSRARCQCGRAGRSDGVLYAQTDGASASLTSLATSVEAVVSGDQRTLVTLVNFADTSLTCTPDAVSDLMFSTTSGISVDAIYRDSSFGSVSVTGSLGRPLHDSGVQHRSCNTGGWADAADAAAAAAGVDPHAFPRRVYVMPSSSCPAAGIAEVGGASTRALDFDSSRRKLS